ncbi:MAG: Rrf2 family transcriptional regulator [Candidatus Rokubacteria bacterium]|nr:Rrf2 family transcriptional regulator [Candidatus Rokubacteria bacterium]
MLRFTKRADYGLMAIHYIASQPEDMAVSAKRIAEELSIPPELLAKILQRLAKRKLIVSHNGPKGGYLLARRPTEVTVGQVVRAVEGPIRIVSCMTEAVDCPQFSKCNLRRPVQKIQSSISYLLDTMTLAELAAEPEPMVPAAALLGAPR